MEKMSELKMSELKISEFYKVVEIEGKGMGCIAMKKIKPGTIILSQKRDVVAAGWCNLSCGAKLT